MEWIAEFRDWLNRTALHLDLRDDASEFTIGQIRIVFQKNRFVDNVVCWRDDVQAEIRLYNFFFSRSDIDEFVIAAKHWLELPLELLGSTHFSGKWRLGATESNQFNLEFRPYYSTPSKTDWFTVRVEISTEEFSWTKELHSDHSCLALFIEGLFTPSEISKSGVHP